MEIRSDRDVSQSITVKVSADGYVEGPAAEIDAGATYTFEGEIDGRWHRWTGQRPTIVGDLARFWLRDGTPIEKPADGRSGRN
jgi:hypothetical protein